MTRTASNVRHLESVPNKPQWALFTERPIHFPPPPSQLALGTKVVTRFAFVSYMLYRHGGHCSSQISVPSQSEAVGSKSLGISCISSATWYRKQSKHLNLYGLYSVCVRHSGGPPRCGCMDRGAPCKLDSPRHGHSERQNPPLCNPSPCKNGMGSGDVVQQHLRGELQQSTQLAFHYRCPSDCCGYGDLFYLLALVFCQHLSAT